MTKTYMLLIIKHDTMLLKKGNSSTVSVQLWARLVWPACACGTNLDMQMPSDKWLTVCCS